MSSPTTEPQRTEQNEQQQRARKRTPSCVMMAKAINECPRRDEFTCSVNDTDFDLDELREEATYERLILADHEVFWALFKALEDQECALLDCGRARDILQICDLVPRATPEQISEICKSLGMTSDTLTKMAQDRDVADWKGRKKEKKGLTHQAVAQLLASLKAATKPSPKKSPPVDQNPPTQTERQGTIPKQGIVAQSPDFQKQQPQTERQEPMSHSRKSTTPPVVHESQPQTTEQEPPKAPKVPQESPSQVADLTQQITDLREKWIDPTKIEPGKEVVINGEKLTILLTSDLAAMKTKQDEAAKREDWINPTNITSDGFQVGQDTFYAFKASEYCNAFSEDDKGDWLKGIKATSACATQAAITHATENAPVDMKKYEKLETVLTKYTPNEKVKKLQNQVKSFAWKVNKAAALAIAVLLLFIISTVVLGTVAAISGYTADASTSVQNNLESGQAGNEPSELVKEQIAAQAELAELIKVGN